jgi:hypothetical protein
MVKLLSFIMVIIIFCNTGSSYAKNNVSKSVDVILVAQRYSWGLVGIPAHSSEEEIAARNIYKFGTTVQVYDVFEKSSNEGKMYFLCILKRRSKESYVKAVAAIKDKNELVSIFSGDVLQKIPMSIIIKEIEVNNCDPLGWPEYR